MDKLKAYNTKELLEILPIGRTMLYRMLRTGEIPSIKLGGKILVTHKTVEKILNAK